MCVKQWTAFIWELGLQNNLSVGNQSNPQVKVIFVYDKYNNILAFENSGRLCQLSGMLESLVFILTTPIDRIKWV